MSGQFVESSDFLFFHKPAGISTHRPSPERFGFVEWCSQKSNLDLKVCHRLDKETSGAIVFAKNKEAAKQLTELFENHQVQKEYWFISDQKSKEEEWIVSEPQIKKGALGEAPENKLGSFSETSFRRITGDGPLYLYKAYPKTGKTHQIRIHATQSGIPILGDEKYEGKTFPRLMLHSHKLEFQLNGQTYLFNAKPSQLFEDLNLCKDQQWVRWWISFERRQILFQELMNEDQTLRLLHDETEDLRVDKVGSVYVAGWWKEVPPSDIEVGKIKKFMDEIGAKQWLFQGRPVDNSRDKLVTYSSSQQIPELWNFKENDMALVGSLDRGHNFGLFLDQRERRQWVKNHSQNKRVLNLFSFSCGFSVAAALGGATEVVSVDVSKKYLEWGRENFSLNNIDPQAHKFYDMDSLDYLSYAKKKSMKFDIIICDPPSFSRHKKSKKVFKIDKDALMLLTACRDVLSEDGVLLFSTNFEAWDFFKWHQWIEENLQNIGFLELESSESQWDYEWQKQDAHLKAFFLKKPCAKSS